MIDEEDQPPEEDFGEAADVIRGLYPQQQEPQMDMIELSRQLGYGSFGGIGKHSKSEIFAKQAQAYMAGRGAAAAQNPVSPEAQFYASVGNMAGAVQMQKTKGPSLFTFGEEIDLGGSTYSYAPYGKMNMFNRATGKYEYRDVADMAMQSGIKTVPFAGGDNQAMLFRNTITRTKGIMDDLNELDRLYGVNNLYIGTLNPSETATKAQQLETKILLDAMAILTGTKSLGGNTSNVDIDMIRTMVPKAASTAFGNMKGNEKARLAELREIIKKHVMNAARANGIDLRETKQTAASQGQPVTGIIPPKNQPAR